MSDLMVQINAVDGGATEALRVIEHFDSLVDQRVSALSLLRTAAEMAQCVVGINDPERGLDIAMDSAGVPVDVAERGETAEIAEFEEITVFLDRGGDTRPLDGLILDRFARSVHALKKARDLSPTVAAMRIAFDPRECPDDRAEALRRIGFGDSVTVVVTNLDDGRGLPPGLIEDRYRINLFPAGRDAVGQLIPDGIAAGLHECPATRVGEEWRHAQTALRIAVDLVTGQPTAVRFDDLGSIATIVEGVDAMSAAAAPDVQRVVELQSKRPWVLATLESILGHLSVREAARMLQLHHSTVRQRIDWLERQLGYRLRDGDGYTRATATLTLCRIAMAADNAAQRSTAASAVEAGRVAGIRHLAGIRRGNQAGCRL